MTTTRQIKATEIFLNEIVFHKMDVMRLYGFHLSEGEYRLTIFQCSLPILCCLLSENGKEGNELIQTIRRAMNEAHAVPLCIDVVSLFGMTQVMNVESVKIVETENKYLITK